MKEGKIGNSKIIVISILLLIVAVIGGYIISNKDIIFSNEKSVDMNEKNDIDNGNDNDNNVEDNNTNDNSNIFELAFDPNKCINNDIYNYIAAVYMRGLSLTLDRDTNTVSVNVFWDSFADYGISGTDSHLNMYTINNFSGKVVEMYLSEIGQDMMGSRILFLLEDGTVEYMPVYEALESKNIKSYGKVNGVEGIVKFYTVSANPKESPIGGIVTTLAQKKDGSFYDLNVIFNGGESIDRSADLKDEMKSDILSFDNTKCINSDAYDYNMIANTSALNLTLDKNTNTVNLNVFWDSLANYGISGTGSHSNMYTINNFSGKVVEMYVSEIGQDMMGERILFLLEDGTIEYMPVYDALESKNIKSYGKVNGVEGVTKFYTVSANPKESPIGGIVTTLAQKKDGSFYDLSAIFNN